MLRHPPNGTAVNVCIIRIDPSDDFAVTQLQCLVERMGLPSIRLAAPVHLLPSPFENGD